MDGVDDIGGVDVLMCSRDLDVADPVLQNCLFGFQHTLLELMLSP